MSSGGGRRSGREGMRRRDRHDLLLAHRDRDSLRVRLEAGQLHRDLDVTRIHPLPCPTRPDAAGLADACADANACSARPRAGVDAHGAESWDEAVVASRAPGRASARACRRRPALPASQVLLRSPRAPRETVFGRSTTARSGCVNCGAAAIQYMSTPKPAVKTASAPPSTNVVWVSAPSVRLVRRPLSGVRSVRRCTAKRAWAPG